MIQLLVLLLATCARAQIAPPRLIVRADDMGFSHAGNEAMLQCYSEGIVTSVELLVPSPWFPEAVSMVTEHPDVDVGVHLALSSEWDNVKWRPVSDCPSLRDADGYFFPRIFRSRSYPGRALVENHWNIQDVEKEFRAQIELARKKVPRISHISGHMHCFRASSEVRTLVERLGKEYGLAVESGRPDVKTAAYAGPSCTSEEKIESFIKMLESLEAGSTYLFIDHPALDTPEVRAIHHLGYEDVATDRQGVTDTLTSPRVRDAIEVNGIQLIDFRDLKK